MPTQPHNLTDKLANGISALLFRYRNLNASKRDEIFAAFQARYETEIGPASPDHEDWTQYASGVFLVTLAEELP